MSQESIRCALIGCGRISQVHLAVIEDHPEVELVAVADLNRSAAEDAGEAWHADAYGDPLEMLEAARPDAVIVCSPPNTHHELTVAALKAGAHVLCEKPLALTLEDALSMQQAAATAGRVLMMASKFRYVQDLIKARSLVRSGLLGRLVSLENEFCAPIDMQSRWNARREIGGGGVLVDNGTHSVDIVRYFLGPIVEVHALEGLRLQPLEVEDSARILCRVQSGVVASVELSWSIDKHNPWYVSIYGSEGTLRVGWQRSRYRLRGKQGWVTFGMGYDKFAAVAGQLNNFVGTIRGKENPLISSQAAADSVRAILAAYRSCSGDGWESVQQ